MARATGSDLVLAITRVIPAARHTCGDICPFVMEK
jgi:hypothetical protein